MTLWRLLPWQARAAPTEPGGALWFPRELQGGGRHDNPGSYGCLYAAETPVSTVAEALAPFRGAGALSSAMLLRAGRPLALVELALDDGSELVDLDDPRVLARNRLRPSQVATNRRAVTQAYAARIYDTQPRVDGLRWWSTLEASLVNVTLYDRALMRLSLVEVKRLTLAHPATLQAGKMLGLAV